MHYSHGNLDRADHLRNSIDKLSLFLNDPKSRYVPVWRDKMLVGTTENSQQKCLLTLPLSSEDQKNHDQFFFLGLEQNKALFTRSLSALNEDDLNSVISAAQTLYPNLHALEFADLRAIGPTLSDEDGALLVYAKGLVHWQDQCRFCSRCGAGLNSQNAGHLKICGNEQCNYQTFPRTDPAVIMLVTRDATEHSPASCLLGRNSAWPTGVYSTLAGFVETGESLEQAVKREVFEEVGIITSDVRYVASQPWPCPRSIMLGFESTAQTDEINIDPVEIEDARWFTREQILTFGTWGDDDAEFKLPRKDSIARMLVERWITSVA